MPQGPSAGPGMLPDLAGPAGMKIYMKEALEQVIELFRAPAPVAALPWRGQNASVTAAI